MEFTDKFTAFIDILGFKGLVAAAESDSEQGLDGLLELLKEFGSSALRDRFAMHGPTVCPQSTFHRRDLHFCLTQISDCAIISAEVSPAGVINLVHHAWGCVIRLLQHGLLCRGYITRGLIYHTDTQVIGSGYQAAYHNEAHVTAFKRAADERGTPFVEIDKTITAYVRESTDACVQEMFRRCVKEDGELVALFPFKRLAHSFIVAGHGNTLDPDKERQANNNVRQGIHRLKGQVMNYVDKNNPDAMSKAAHYLAALDAQLAVCDKTDEFLSQFTTPGQPAR